MVGVYIAGISSPSILTQGDESDYIRTSQEMYASGDYLTPRLRGELRFTKPPLLYWLVAGSYHLFGVSFFAARLPAVLCAALTVLFVFRMGLLLFDRKSAWLSALITGTSFGMIKFSKIVLMESPLVLTFLLAFYYFVRFYREEKGHFLIAAFGFFGLAALIKSPVYSLIGVVAIVLFLFSEARLERLFRPALLGAVAVALFIALPWYWAMIVLHGPLFTDFYLNEHVNKFGNVEHFMLRVFIGLLIYMLPWTGYAFHALWAIFREGLHRNWNYKLLLIIMGFFLAVFLIPDQKGLYYSVPLLPFCGLMTGGILGGRFAPGKYWDYATAWILVIAALIFFGSVGLLGSAKVFSLIASLLASGAAVFLLRGQRTVAILVAGLALVPLYSHIFPSINFEIIPVEKTLEIAADKPVYSYRISPLKFSTALGKEVRELLEPKELDRSLAEGGFLIISSEDYRNLDRARRARMRILLEWKRWRRRIPYGEFFGALWHGKPERLHEKVLLVGR